MAAKIVYLLTRDGKAYTDEGLIVMKNSIRNLYNDDSNLIFSMGSELNNPDILSKLLKQNDGSGYLAVSMPVGSSYFTGKEKLQAYAKFVEKHRDNNPWEVMAYAVWRHNPDAHNYTPTKTFD